MAERSASPWSLSENLDPNSFLQAGQTALATGKVTPEEAMANLKDLSPVLKYLGIGTNPLLSGRSKTAMNVRDAQDMLQEKRAEAATTGTVNTPTQDPAVFQKTEVRPVAPGSGLKNQQDFTNQILSNLKNDSKAQGQYLLAMDPEQLQEMYSRTAELPAFKEQAQGIKKMQDLLSMQNDNTADYFSGPLAGLLETEFGRRVGALSSNRGQTPMEMRKQILDTMGKVQDDRRDLSKSIFDAISKQKAGTYTESQGTTNALNELVKSVASSTAADPNAQMRQQNPNQTKLKVFQEFQKEARPIREALQAVQTAQGVLNSGSKVADQAVQVMLARASGDKGALSNQDVARYAGSQALQDRALRALQKWEDGRLTESDRADLLILSRTYEKFLKANIEKNVGYFSDNVAPALGLGSEETKRMLLPSGGYGLSKETINPKAAAEASGEKLVSVIGPNGVKGKVPASKLQKALAQGYKEAK